MNRVSGRRARSTVIGWISVFWVLGVGLAFSGGNVRGQISPDATCEIKPVIYTASCGLNSVLTVCGLLGCTAEKAHADLESFAKDRIRGGDVSLGEIATALEATGKLAVIGLRDVGDIGLGSLIRGQDGVVMVLHLIRSDGLGHFVVGQTEKGANRLRVYDYPRKWGVPEASWAEWSRKHGVSGNMLIVGRDSGAVRAATSVVVGGAGRDRLFRDRGSVVERARSDYGSGGTVKVEGARGAGAVGGTVSMEVVRAINEGRPDGVVDLEVRVTNSGESEMKAISGRGDCGCVVAFAGPKALAAKGEGAYVVKVKRSGLSGSGKIQLVLAWEAAGEKRFVKLDVLREWILRQVGVTIKPSVAVVRDRGVIWFAVEGNQRPVWEKVKVESIPSGRVQVVERQMDISSEGKEVLRLGIVPADAFFDGGFGVLLHLTDEGGLVLGEAQLAHAPRL